MRASGVSLPPLDGTTGPSVTPRDVSLHRASLRLQGYRGPGKRRSAMALDEDERDGPEGSAAHLLRRCQMPQDEIRWVLTAEDPAVVHMILELHRERLEGERPAGRNAP